jgi:integrase
MRVKLTARNIAKAVREYKGNGGEVVLHDTDLSGYMLRLRGKRRTFMVRYGTRQDRQRYVLGELGPLNPDDARKLAIKTLGEYASGRDPARERKASRAVPAFSAWADEYLEGVKQRKKWPREDERFLMWAKRRWGNKPLDKVTAGDVEKTFRLLASDGHKIAANRWLASVRACLQAAWRLDKIPSNPAMKVRPLPENAPRARVLTDKEFDRLQDAIVAIENPHVRAAFTLLVATGARVSEVLRAKWADFELDAGEWRIPSPKAGRPQVVPLPKPLSAFLRKLPQVGALVVPGHNDPKKARFDLKKPWDEIRQAAQLPDVHLHDLRRTFGLRVTRAAGLHVASKLLRHADVRVTEQVYAPLGLADLRKATETQAAGLAKILPIERRAPKGNARKRHGAGTVVHIGRVG